MDALFYDTALYRDGEQCNGGAAVRRASCPVREMRARVSRDCDRDAILA